MAKITREKVEKINDKMGNGWALDVWYYLVHGDKTAEIKIATEDGGYIQGKLYIENVFDWHEDAYNGVQIKLNVSRWHKGHADGVFTSSGLGHWVIFNRPDLKKAMFSEVQKMTNEISAEDIMAIAAEHAPALANARIL